MKTAIITGANSGLGFETAKKIAGTQDYEVILACRNEEKAAKAKEEIVSATGNDNVLTMKLDTSSLESVRAFAKAFIDTGKKIDVLINNAGISSMGNTGLTADGFDLVFETNFIGHFLLTNLLLPYFADNSRIINISSDMHNPPGGVTWPGAEAVCKPAEIDRKSYSYSKLAMIYFTHELDRRFKADGKKIVVNSFNPGFMADTNFSKGGGKARELVVKTTMPDRFAKLDTSCQALFEVATDDKLAGVSNEYFDRSTNTARSSELSYNDDNEKQLWDKCSEYVGLAR